MKVSFIEGFSRLIFEQLVNQELTLCLFHNPPEHKAVEIHPLVEETMYLVGPPAANTGLKPAKPGMDLQSLPMILPNRTHALRRLLEEALDAQDLHIAVETDGIVTTRALVAAGLGYTILPYSAVHNQLMTGQVSSVRLDGLRIPWTLSLACRSNQRSTRPVDAILDILTSHIDVIKDEASLVRRQRPRSVAAIS
jgi:LysR family nitrogen assimilation transcriptional regulator